MKSAQYNTSVNTQKILEKVEKLALHKDGMKDSALMHHIFSLIDLTSLNSTDSDTLISTLTGKVNKLHERFPEFPNVAAICVYPPFVPVVRKTLQDDKVKIASVAGSFPSSQTFLDIKLAEVERVISEGADEIDVVISLGKFLEGRYEIVSDELKEIKKVARSKTFKVIIESGNIRELSLIKTASFLALEAGADFIKTSTGKLEVGAKPEAVYVMCEAIKEYSNKSGRIAGIKPAGGISEISSAVHYFLIVNDVLGNDWLQPERFRIGTSKLANLLLGESYF